MSEKQFLFTGLTVSGVSTGLAIAISFFHTLMIEQVMGISILITLMALLFIGFLWEEEAE